MAARSPITQCFALASLLSLWACRSLAPPAPSLHIALDRRLDPDMESSVRAEVVGIQRRLRDQLALPATTCPIRLELFADEPTFQNHVAARFPQFPMRRAVFVQSSQGMEVLAQWGPHIAEDLRHETVHACLHAAVDNLPLWLDEGLAEYFETMPAPGEIQTRHLDILRAQRTLDGWRPDMQRLEALRDPAQMTEADYAESWLWVHWMLAGPQRLQVVRDYLADLQSSSDVAPLSRRLEKSQPDAVAQIKLWIDAI